MKTFVTLFRVCDPEHLYKDLGMIPYIMEKYYGYKSKIVCMRSDKINETIKLSPIEIEVLNRNSYEPDIFPPIQYITFLIKNARKIDVLNLYQPSKLTFLTALVYKLLNPSGKVYVKMDMDFNKIRNTKTFRGEIFRKIFSKLITAISTETNIGFQNCMKEWTEYKEKLIYIPNGSSFEESKINKNVIKENIIISVGRIGTEQKNNEMFLKALKSIDLKDWKVYFIGPIEHSFMKVIEVFYNENLHLNNKVYFTGNISDKNKLAEYYAKAKIFCFTSRWEGFALVLSEALYFNNYIITTDVGGARDVTDNFRYGYKITDEIALASILDDIILGKINIEDNLPTSEFVETFSYKKNLTKILEKLT